MDKERARKLVEEHWKFLEKVLATPPMSESAHFTLGFVGLIYKEAMIHGYKHGYEDAKKGK